MTAQRDEVLLLLTRQERSGARRPLLPKNGPAGNVFI